MASRYRHQTGILCTDDYPEQNGTDFDDGTEVEPGKDAAIHGLSIRILKNDGTLRMHF